MPTSVTIPGHGDVEFPDSMSDADVLAAVHKLSPPAPSAAEAVGRGAMKGAPNKLLASSLAMAEQQAEVKNPEYIPGTDMLDVPTDAGRFTKTYQALRGQQKEGAAAAEKAHPLAFMAGEAAPAVASMAIPGAVGVKGAAALGGALGVEGSEAEEPEKVAEEGALGAALGAGGAKALQAVEGAAGAAGRWLLPKARAWKDRIVNAIGDKSAAAAEAIAKSAQGTAGATRANASRTVERLGMDTALPAADQAANAAATQTPEAQQLASELAARARGELPDKLAQMQTAEALAKQTAADAAAARSPEAIAAKEKAMRAESLKLLATRYALPGALGYVLGDQFGGHGGLGAMAGFGARPMLRATLRHLTSPGFTAPLSRAATSAAETLAHLGGANASKAGALLEPEIEPRLAAWLEAMSRPQPQQLAQEQ